MTKKTNNPHEISIKYNGRILLIKNNSLGAGYKFQWGGINCYQFRNKGNIVTDFRSSNKYFNPDYWINAVDWFLDSNEIWFSNSSSEDIDIKNLNTLLSFYNKKRKEAEKEKFSTELILQEILEETQKQTKLNVQYHGATKIYGKDWGEAYVPVLIDNHKGILTWQNCD